MADPKVMVPVINVNGDSFKKDPEAFIDFAFKSSVMGSSADRNDRERPYDGQPWTYYGERGQQEIKGWTMRDLHDCIVRAILGFGARNGNGLLQMNLDKGTWTPTDVYMVNREKIEPLSLIQNTCNEIEEMMGIFPNLPKSTPPAEDLMDFLMQQVEGPMLGD